MTEPRIIVLRTEPCIQFAVQSSSRAETWHTVSYDLATEAMDCSCPAFSFYDHRGLCKHCLAVIRYAAAESNKKRSRNARNSTPAPTSRVEATS